MEQLNEILRPMSKARRESLEYISKRTPQERLEDSVKAMNEIIGDKNKSDGYDCPKCRNKGLIFYVDGNSEMSCECSCMKIRQNIRRMKRSGLENVIKDCTFAKYEATDDWQKNILAGAKKFAEEVDNLEKKWFFMGGQSGSGKTHLCTAIARELLLRGKELRYMRWIDDSRTLKAIVNDEKYEHFMNQFKNTEVLYIDDLFKIQPNEPDIRLAYEILNYRTQNPKLITIISSERHINEIIDIDTAVGSRIYDDTKNHAFNIGRDPKRNYRTRDIVTI